MKKVFLIFSAEDASKVKNLAPLLSSPEYDLDSYEGSLDVDFDAQAAEAVKRAMGEKIVQCSISLCLIGENTYDSKWADLQLQKSRNKGNRIIAMALKGIKNAALPGVITEEHLTFYPWDPQRLKKLIAEDMDSRYNNKKRS
jgi:hypothetical protein